MLVSDVFIYLAKILPLAIYPLGLALIILLFGLLFGGLCWARASLIGAFTLLWLASLPVVAGWATRTLERQHPPINLGDLPQADVAIVLGGAIHGPSPPRRMIELVDSSDRVLMAVRLFRAGKVKRILVTGGNLPWSADTVPEANHIRDLLIEWGVPHGAILITGTSRNTRENALEIRSLRETQSFGSALLVTSALHMPRALAVFLKAGLPVFPATTDVQIVDGPLTLFDWLPDAAALARTTSAAKEWIGFGVYRWLGYL
jgi:uncharacterized SAM-binding protein YcdF (DUF218 family)